MSHAITAGTAPVAKSACDICRCPDGTTIVGRETMYGWGERFAYWECASCRCVQIVTIPSNLGRYYPANYYSFESFEPPTPLPASKIRRWAYQHRNASVIADRGLFWRMVGRWRPRPDFRVLDLAHTGVHAHSRILDVGCGNGTLLRRLASAGFDHLLGIDPFLGEDVDFGPSLRMLSTTLDSVDDKAFDLIMFNHSLEHMPDQLGVLRKVASALKPGGVCMIEVPVAGSDPWKAYREDWIELDPPRHFYLHTLKSLAVAADGASLAIERIKHLASTFPYWGSELCRRGIPLVRASGHVDPKNYFNGEEMHAFEERARRAQVEERSGRVRFYLRARSSVRAASAV